MQKQSQYRVYFASMLPVLALALLVFGCNKGAGGNNVITTKITAENQKRLTLGLRLVSTNWNLYRAEFGEEDWQMTASDSRIAKKVHRNPNGNLVWEEDYYFSGRMFVTAKGQNWEMLTLHYDYSSSGLNVDYIGQDLEIIGLVSGVALGGTIDKKLATADEILKKWGLSRR